MRDFESSNDISPNEFLCIHVPDVGQGLDFDPFGEIVYADHQVSFISCCFKERAYDIQAPLSERPRTGEGIKDPSRLVDIWSKLKELRNGILAIFFCSAIGICQIEANVEFSKINFILG